MSRVAMKNCQNGVILAVSVRPRSREKRFVAEVGQESIVLNLQSPAQEGKANIELLKRLAKTLSLSTGDMTIVSGHRSRDKTLMIRGLTVEQVMSSLQAALNA